MIEMPEPRLTVVFCAGVSHHSGYAHQGSARGPPGARTVGHRRLSQLRPLSCPRKALLLLRSATRDRLPPNKPALYHPQAAGTMWTQT